MENTLKKQLILNADDYAACQFINDGIIEAIKMNKINSVSCFVTHRDRAEQDILALIDLQQTHDFKIGLHFSITCGSPITRCTTMRPQPGKPFYELHQHNYLDINLDELRTELINQINVLQSYLDQKGAGKVDHITVHHSVVYFFDRLFKVYWEVAKEFDIAIRSPLPWSKSDLNFYSYKEPRDIYDLAIPVKLEGIKNGAKAFWDNLIHGKLRDREMLKMLKSQKKENIALQINSIRNIIRHPHCYADTIYGQPYLENIMFLVSQVPENSTVELMFHLGTGNENENLPAGINRGYFKYRKRELAAIRHLDLLQIMKDRKIGMTNYSKI